MSDRERRFTRRQAIVQACAAAIVTTDRISANEADYLQSQPPEASVRASRKLPPLPDREGFAGMFAGIAGDKLIVAGGANFPRGYPWEGGQKVWYDDVFVLDSPDSKSWARAELRLPVPAAYGVSFSWSGRTWLVGGETGSPNNSPECLASVISIGFEKGRLTSKQEPPLPEPLKDSCGALVGSRFFVFGGTNSASSSRASNRLYYLELNSRDRSWRRGPDLPSAGRIQSIAGTDGHSLLIYSGIELAPGSDGKPLRVKPYLREVWRFAPGMNPREGKWNRLADMPREAAASPTSAFATPTGEIAILSGARSADHEIAPSNHPGWCRDVLMHDPKADRWRIGRGVFGTVSPVVTAPSVRWRNSNLVISGEIAPGRRSPAIIEVEFDQ
jgi:N-acetylneuraminic acid mutarotase